MPLVYQQNINETTKLAVWQISEPASFFSGEGIIYREIAHPQKRLQHLAGRYLLREVFPDFPYEHLDITASNKPFLKNGQYQFSISHGRDFVAVIVSKDHQVGIDIELVHPKINSISHKFLNESEEQLLAKLPIQAGSGNFTKEMVLTLVWSVKEAMFKWYGKGAVDFKKHLNIFAFDFDGKKGIASSRCHLEDDRDLNVYLSMMDEYSLAWLSTKIE